MEWQRGQIPTGLSNFATLIFALGILLALALQTICTLMHEMSARIDARHRIERII